MSDYTVTEAVDGGYILLRNGHEIGQAEEVHEAALLAAKDAVDGYPESEPDFMHDVALDRGMSLATAVRQDWFVEALAGEISSMWPEAAKSPAP